MPIAGKTGTTNDAKDVWFIGYSSNIVAGCYLGYDQPRSLGERAYGGTLCVPVFNAFMREAVAEYGGTEFTVPPGGYWVKIDRITGQRLPDDASGPNVIAEYFRDGTDPDWLTPYVVSGFGDEVVILPWESRGQRWGAGDHDLDRREAGHSGADRFRHHVVGRAVLRPRARLRPATGGGPAAPRTPRPSR